MKIIYHEYYTDLINNGRQMAAEQQDAQNKKDVDKKVYFLLAAATFGTLWGVV